MGVYVSPHKYTNMKSIFIQQFLGSSLLSPAYGCGGTRATKNMIVRPPKKIWAKPKQAGKKEGGLGEGIFARLPKRSTAALLVQSRTPQKSFLFFLKEKIRRAQNKKCEENFFAGWRASASGGAEHQSSQSGFSSKKVRILTKRYRQISKFEPKQNKGFWAKIICKNPQRCLHF